MSIKNIKELKKKYGDGKGLSIQMDNDVSYVFPTPKKGVDTDTIFEGEGYNDCEALWKLAFPKAKVEWC